MKIKEVIVVEGKSDTALLKSVLDVDTIETNGSRVSKKTLDLIKEAQKTRGIIILTDPDYPGMRIRHIVEEAVPGCKHAFIDRKDAIKHGKLGVAETPTEIVLKALEDVVSFEKERTSLTWEEFLDLDIIGHKEKRLEIYRVYHLGYGNVKTLFKRLNMLGITKEEIEEKLK